MRFTSTLHHTCNECDSEFSIHYNADEVESDPMTCPFCTAYIIDGDTESDEDD